MLNWFFKVTWWKRCVRLQHHSCFTPTVHQITEAGLHLSTLSMQLHHGDIFCLHTSMIPNASQLCKHLEITLTEPSWHASDRNSLLPAVSLLLWLKCFLSSISSRRLPSSSYRLFFIHGVTHLPIIVLVVKFGADPLCPLVLILCYYDQSSCFRILLRHSCRVINWPHVSSGWCDTRGIRVEQENGKIMLCHLVFKRKTVTTVDTASIYITVRAFAKLLWTFSSFGTAFLHCFKS